jgi:arylsulfatase A-like enzyme
VTDPGRSVDMPVPMLDLLPTLVDAAGAPMPELVHGESLLPVLAGGEPVEREFYSQNRVNRTNYQQDALFQGYTKLIYTPLRDRTELYDFHTDPGEQHDLAATDPERAAVMRRQLRAWEVSVVETWASLPKSGLASEEVDQATQDALRKIGY